MTDLARSPEQIGNAIRRARKNAGMSQSELGKKTGLRQGTVSQIEKGHAAAKLETILIILAVLNLELQIHTRSNKITTAAMGLYPENNKLRRIVEGKSYGKE